MSRLVDPGEQNQDQGRDQGKVQPKGPSERTGTPVVVVGIDGSETSWDAFCWACGETTRLSGRAIAVFVGPVSAAVSAAAAAPFSVSAIAYGAISQTQSEEAERLCHELCSYATERGVDLTFVHAHGDTMKELLRVADEAHADLIVVGKSTKARHQVAGSLGRRLTGCRNAPIVVVVP
jgi:nucleotide-binding universal stress UspA family protein